MSMPGGNPPDSLGVCGATRGLVTYVVRAVRIDFRAQRPTALQKARDLARKYVFPPPGRW